MFHLGYKLTDKQIAFILDIFYGGSSLRRIASIFRHFFGLPISPPTVLRRVVGWSELCHEAILYFLKAGEIVLPSKAKIEFKLHLGNIWEIDETYIPFKGEQRPLILLRDLKTGFMFGKLTNSVTKSEIKEVLKMARSLTCSPPEEIRCDGLHAYAKPVKAVFNGQTKLSVHKREGRRGMNQAIEGTIRAFKDRIKRMLGLHSCRVSPIIIRGSLLDYNFVRRSEALGGKTPAELAIKQKPLMNQWESWLFLIKMGKYYKASIFARKMKSQDYSNDQILLDRFFD